MLRSGTVISLHELKAMGKSIREIVRETGLARNSVRNTFAQTASPSASLAPNAASKLDPFKPLLDDYIAQGITNCEVLWECIRLQGYTGGKTLVKDYVKPFRPPRLIPAVQRYETKPGEQAQVDWGIGEYVDEHGVVAYIRFQFLIGTIQTFASPIAATTS